MRFNCQQNDDGEWRRVGWCDERFQHSAIKNSVAQIAAQHRLQRIAATDRQIDELVYELYNLAPDEIAVLEGTQGILL